MRLLYLLDKGWGTGAGAAPGVAPGVAPGGGAGGWRWGVALGAIGMGAAAHWGQGRRMGPGGALSMVQEGRLGWGVGSGGLVAFAGG